jgi:hypothetical protein
MPAVIVQIDGWDPVASVAVTIRACSHTVPSVCHLDNKVWWPVLSKLPALRYDLFDGSFGTAITAPSSDLTLSIEPWPTFARYSLADALIQLWTGEPGIPFAQWTRRMVGRLSEQPKIAAGVASVSFAVDDSWLDTPLLSLYAGTTGAEGEAAQKGTPKPLALGAPRYVPGVMIDSVNTILQLSSYGAVQGIDVALEKLSRFSASVGNYATFADLKAAAIPRGRWATCLSAGLVRHGAPLNGQPSYLMRGDVAGSGGWVRLPGAIIKRIAEIAGAGDRVSVASLAALDAARPWPLSLWLDQQVTPRAIIQRIAASVNAVAGVSWLGELFVVPIGIGAPSATLNTDGSSLPPVGDVSQVVAGQPFWRLALQAERTWQVHALGDVAFTAPLIEFGRYDPTTTYREGNIVDLEDGSRWLYAAATPSAGNAPSADSGYWSSLSGPVRPTYDDGTPIDDLKPAEPGATNGAPGNSPFGDTTAQAALDKLNVNGMNVLAAVLQGPLLEALVKARTTIDGQDLATVVVDLTQEVTTGTGALAQSLRALGAGNEDNSAFVINAETAQIGPGKNLAQSIKTLESSSSDYDASITRLDEILTDKSGTTLRTINVMTLGGAITGTYNTLTKEFKSEYVVVADVFKVINPNGGAPITPFSIINGVVTMLDVEVANIRAGSVTIAGIAAGLSKVTRYTQADTTIGTAEVTLCETDLFDVGDGVGAGNALATINFEHDGLGVRDSAASFRIYVDTGSGYAQFGPTRRSGIIVAGGSGYWVLNFAAQVPISALGKARVRLTGTGLSIQNGPAAGTVCRGVTIDVMKIGR